MHALSAQAAGGFAYLLVVQRGHALDQLGHLFWSVGPMWLFRWVTFAVQFGPRVCNMLVTLVGHVGHVGWSCGSLLWVPFAGHVGRGGGGLCVTGVGHLGHVCGPFGATVWDNVRHVVGQVGTCCWALVSRVRVR